MNWLDTGEEKKKKREEDFLFCINVEVEVRADKVVYIYYCYSRKQ